MVCRGVDEYTESIHDNVVIQWMTDMWKIFVEVKQKIQ